MKTKQPERDVTQNRRTQSAWGLGVGPEEWRGVYSVLIKLICIDQNNFLNLTLKFGYFCAFVRSETRSVHVHVQQRDKLRVEQLC